MRLRPSLLVLLHALPATGAPLHVRLLEVRLLERERLLQVELEAPAGRLHCDGVPLPQGPSRLAVLGHALALPSGRTCQAVTSTGDRFTVRFGDEQRRYPGRLDARSQEGHLRLVDVVEVERYLPAVVAAELGAAPPAALEAQAVVSRTFALASRGRHGAEGYDLCDLTHCQLYPGLEAEKSPAFEAVARTRGEVLRVGGVRLRPSWFHAACGGATSSARDVFGEEALTDRVDDLDPRTGRPFCAGAPDFRWEWRVPRPTLAAALGVPARGGAFEPLQRDAAGRVLELRSFGVRLSGMELASRLGHRLGYRLRSLKVGADEVEGMVRFEGQGLGHGVGLCQHGARARAAAGATREAILRHYFPSSRPGRAP